METILPQFYLFVKSKFKKLRKWLIYKELQPVNKTLLIEAHVPKYFYYATSAVFPMVYKNLRPRRLLASFSLRLSLFSWPLAVRHPLLLCNRRLPRPGRGAPISVLGACPDSVGVLRLFS